MILKNFLNQSQKQLVKQVKITGESKATIAAI